nr:MAG TPA: hypothetical protein [Podoviridae sp. ct7dS1]
MTGIFSAKELCLRTSRVNSSIFTSVTACDLLLAIRTPARVTIPVIMAATIVSTVSPP